MKISKVLELQRGLEDVLAGFYRDVPAAGGEPAHRIQTAFLTNPNLYELGVKITGLREGQADSMIQSIASTVDTQRGWAGVGLWAGLGSLLLPGLGTMIGLGYGLWQKYVRDPDVESRSLDGNTLKVKVGYRNLTLGGIRDLLRGDLSIIWGRYKARWKNDGDWTQTGNLNQRHVEFTRTKESDGTYTLGVKYAADPTARSHYVAQDISYIIQALADNAQTPNVSFSKRFADSIRESFGAPAWPAASSPVPAP